MLSVFMRCLYYCSATKKCLLLLFLIPLFCEAQDCNITVNAGKDQVVEKTSVVTLSATPLSSGQTGIWKHVSGATPVWWSAKQIAPYTSSVSVPKAAPLYLQNQRDARWPQTMIKRISDATLMKPLYGTSWNNFGPWYATRQHWNADNTLMLMQAISLSNDGNYNGHNSAPSNFILLNGKTGEYIKPAYSAKGSLPQMFRWSNTDPNLVYFINGSAPILRYWKPLTDEYGIAKDFSSICDGISSTFGGGVNDPSIDGRYWALPMRKGSQWFISVWDSQTDHIVSNIPIPYEPNAPNAPIQDHDMSRSGNYVIITSFTDWVSGNTPIAKGVAVFNRNGNYLRSINIDAPLVNPIVTIGGHHTLVLTENGEDRYVAMYSPDGIERWMVSYNLANGSRRDESEKGVYFGGYYISGQSFNRPDIAIISDLPVTSNNSAFNKFPLQRHISAIKIDGSKKLYPIAQELISLTDFSSADQYYLCPWATANRDASVVFFKSPYNTDWSSGLPSVFHAYIATPTVEIVNENSPQTLVQDLPPGRHVFSWTVTTSGGCVASDEVVIVVCESQGNCAPLSVNFGNLNVEIVDQHLVAEWVTLKEQNNDRFDIEYSSNGKNFIGIGSVKSKHVNGYEDTITHYRFQQPLSKLPTMIGAGLLALMAIGATIKKNRVILLASTIALFLFFACIRNHDVLSEHSNRYIRIVSIDKDGKKEYSKTVKAIEP